MDTLLNAVYIVCAAAVAASVLSLLTPDGRNRRVVAVVTGLFIICCLIFPIRNLLASGVSLDIEIPPEEQISEGSDQAYTEALLAETKLNLEAVLAVVLTQNNFNVKKSEIKLNTNPDGGIYIEQISIFVPKGFERQSELKSVVRKRFETVPEIIIT